ncbi:LysR family transcriptional regulator [Arenibaculum pallidiluteum]|uniref:LysR family transcriptional regulator n=1 Tax=Arenibaculum pallidiluteum TaxID=2812559 RepID=UPI001A95DC7C|nr:LysR family transcriptional regulator [Arenibaculum pallidiluteum]
MRTDSLETFVLIATLGSFRAAARRLNTTQPAVSARIAALESELGVELFDRSSRSVALTPKGIELLPLAERVTALMADIVATVSTPAAVRGVLRLGVSETIVHTWLPTLIERLNVRFPSVAVELMIDTTLNLAEDLHGRELDLALLLGPVNGPDIVNHRLCSYELDWVASPQLDLPPEPLSVAALARLPIITYPRGSAPFAAIQNLFRDPDIPPPKLNGSSSLLTTVRLVADGLGVSAVPQTVVRRELTAGELRIVRTTHRLPPLDFTASFPSRPYNPVAEIAAEIAVEIATEHAAAQKLSTA